MKELIRYLEELINELTNSLYSESHVVAEIYYHLRNYKSLNSEKIILEKHYPDNIPRKCDIFIDFESGIWIEVKGYFKNETVNTRSGKHTKDKSSPIKACDDLMKIKDGIKLLIVYQNVVFNSKKYTWDYISKICSNANIRFLRKIAL